MILLRNYQQDRFLIKPLSYIHWIERHQNISVYKELLIFKKCALVPLFISVFLLHFVATYGVAYDFFTFFFAERIKYIIRLSVCSETSRNQHQGKEDPLKGTHIFLSSRDTFLVANFRDYSHINNCSFPPKFGQDASTYTSITACISSFLTGLMLFVQCVPSLLELKLLVPRTISTLT